MDRFVCAVTGGFLGFVIWSFGYLIVLAALTKAAARQVAAGPIINPFDKLPAFSWGGLVVAGFAVFGTVVGAERMMDAFEKVVRVEGKVAEHINRS